jgi:two-component system KDP operon response regulator KdpE
MGDGKSCILIVDDEQPIRRFLRVALQSHGYEVIEAVSGQTAISTAMSHNPDFIILDLGLPDMDGVEVARLLRQWSQVPIIILSVRGSESDKIAALDAGADDYLTKPFGIGELLARLRAAQRRIAQVPSEPIIILDDLVLDLANRIVTVNGHEVQLTPTEYNLLRILAVQAGKVLTHHQLLREVWGPGYDQESHILHVNISNLRRKIEADPARPQLIVTEPGVGYRLKTR